ncbi:MAG: heat-inducible transcription repressor HrcA [Candidatus Hydrogenedentes bacterium]|nr:heat-inducible transcription repressor HrcA [Candidatus Hydrogenedentota bacterium]
MESCPTLSEREELILRAVVHTYVTTAEAVGSRAIVKRLGLDLSPATVRNVMADLEDSGYVQQLHTSSGRIPTDLGYRYYVDRLMDVAELSPTERERIDHAVTQPWEDADETMRQTCHLLADVSHQTGMVEAPAEGNAEVLRIELVSVAPNRLGVVIADTYGRIRSLMVVLDAPVSAAEVHRLNSFLNDHLPGLAFEEVISSLVASLETLFDERRRLAERALDILSMLPSQRVGHMFLDGTTQLFEQPEFRDVVRIREVLSFLEERHRLATLIRSRLRDGGSSQMLVLIGSEAQEQGFEEISLVARPYRVGAKIVGMLGVLGPRRMPYSRMTALVDYTAESLSRHLTRIAG